MYGRRDWRAADRATAPHRRRPLSTFAAESHRATHREACQATNASAPASVANSMASSERSDLGSACTTVTAGDGRGNGAAVEHPRRQPALADILDDTVRHRAVAVAEVEFLAGADAPDVGRVEALVAVDDRQLTDLGQRVDVEERGARVTK